MEKMRRAESSRKDIIRSHTAYEHPLNKIARLIFTSCHCMNCMREADAVLITHIE